MDTYPLPYAGFMTYIKHPKVGGHEKSLIAKGTKMSSKDLEAISKMHVGNYPTGSVVSCDICGSPIAGSSKSNPEEFAREMSAGRHFSCHMEQVNNSQAAILNAATIEKKMAPWDDPRLSEDEKARLFNQDESDRSSVEAARAVQNEKPNVYIPPKGSMPLKDIVDGGGLSAKDPKNFAGPDVIPSDDDYTKALAELEAAKAVADEEMRKQFANGDPGLIIQNPEELFKQD